jgi:hypothetical protein
MPIRSWANLDVLLRVFVHHNQLAVVKFSAWAMLFSMRQKLPER